MISNLNLMYDINEITKCQLLERMTMPLPGTKIKAYIPRIMQNIEKSPKPMERPTKYQYKGAFINSPACRPTVSGVIKEKNYIEGELDSNATVTPVATTAYDGEGQITMQIVPAGEELRCNFLNGKLSQLRVGSDDTRNTTFGEDDKQINWADYDSYAKGTPGGDSEDGEGITVSEGTPVTPQELTALVDKYENALYNGATASELKKIKKDIRKKTLMEP